MFDAVDHFLFLSLSWHPVAGRFYCPVCISQVKPPAHVGWAQRVEVASHLRVAHGWESPELQDALSQRELIEALMRWRKEQEEAADGFVKSLMLVRDVDDFLDECVTGG